MRQKFIAKNQLEKMGILLDNLTTIYLNQRQICDLECLMNGSFFPLTGFAAQEEYNSIVETMRLPSGDVWPMPITLDISSQIAQTLNPGDHVGLKDQEGNLLAVLTTSDIWEPNKSTEAKSVFGTINPEHPGVNYLLNQTQPIYIGGKIIPIAMPKHYDFPHLRFSAYDIKKQIEENGWKKVVAFQTRNPMHRAHQELTIRAAKQIDANILIHPVVGQTKPGDIDHYTRVRCYEKLLKHYPENTSLLSLLPLAMRMAGPKEALWHAIIRKNHGCTHFIVGRDHAGPGSDSKGVPFYDPYAAQELVSQYENEVGIQMVPFQEIVYVKDRESYAPIDEVKPQETVLRISGTKIRKCLQEGSEIPGWFSYPEIIQELRKTHPKLENQGLTIFFTGLSGAGKSTIANALLSRLMEVGDKSITLLDGDIVRKHLSSELGFSKEHRDLNILRIGFVASEITKHRGVAICAPIAPYQKTRREVRKMINEYGNFIEVYVSTSLEICEKRDVKGLYKLARAGTIKEFTGISDPYEAPEKPEISIDTQNISVEQAVQQILDYLQEQGYIKHEININAAQRKAFEKLS